MADVEALKKQAADMRAERESISLQIETLKQRARQISAALVPVEDEIVRLAPKPKGVVTKRGVKEKRT